MSNANCSALPAVGFLKIPENGQPYLEGLKCQECNAVFIDKRTVCAKCGARNQLKPFKLANKGKIHAYSIVHRSFPGIAVPFISAIVDLEGGGTVKGNLIGVEPKPEAVKFGAAVEVVFKDALGRKDKEGNSYLSFFFQPAA